MFDKKYVFQVYDKILRHLQAAVAIKISNFLFL